MPDMNPLVDQYLLDGCGRCELYATPACKVHTWAEELKLLRSILLECGLTEELKWKQPCYTVDGKNVLILAAFKDFCSLNFFKGALMADNRGTLVSPGPNSQASRYLKFTSVDQVMKLEPVIRDYVDEAVGIERSGQTVSFKKVSEWEVPEELEAKMAEDPAFASAFYALTPGRQRGYILHFSSAKNPATRVSRIEKCQSRIFEGKGFHDR